MAHSQPWMGDQRWSSTRMVFGEVSLWQAHGPRGPCTPWSAWPLGQSHNASVQTISPVCALTDRGGHSHTGGHYAYQGRVSDVHFTTSWHSPIPKKLLQGEQ